MADNFLERQYAAYLEQKSGTAHKRQSISVFHQFHTDISDIDLPTRFTNPFDYQPHRLCQLAAGETQAYIASQPPLHRELEEGKMFGVLVVKRMDGKVGFLSAFSGTLLGQMVLPYFVPPIYDQTQSKGYFRQEEHQISLLHRQYVELLRSEPYLQAKAELENKRRERDEYLQAMRESFRQAKERSHRLRADGQLTPEEEASLMRESQFQKAEIKRQEQRLAMETAPYEEALNRLDEQASLLQKAYNQRSMQLQQWLFEQYELQNAKGEQKPLLEVHPAAPSGTGDCAAPKLLQYAFLHHMQPLCMAEFWWGKGNHEHGHYYSSCQAKCKPLLRFMLQGLEVDDPYSTQRSQMLIRDQELEILFEDDYFIAINKPAGLLSVPGHAPIDNAVDRLKRQRMGMEVYAIHRLDMDTSGILLFAKDTTTLSLMQQAFEQRKVHKQYIALLEARPAQDQGVISLPLAPNYEEHPLQMVDLTHGHQAITRYRVIDDNNSKCDSNNGPVRVIFEPQTGRTHQLRVHASHRLGLHCPICGDTLYGETASRLFLHASRLSFEHPYTRQTITIHCKETF